MAVKIRLRRMGRRNTAFYRIVIQEACYAPTGRFIEIVGWYDPQQKEKNFSLNLERTKYWLKNGAQPSDTVRSLIKKAEPVPTSVFNENGVPEIAADTEKTAEQTELAGKNVEQVPNEEKLGNETNP